jgi:hypothetical protein
MKIRMSESVSNKNIKSLREWVVKMAWTKKNRSCSLYRRQMAQVAGVRWFKGSFRGWREGGLRGPLWGNPRARLAVSLAARIRQCAWSTRYKAKWLETNSVTWSNCPFRSVIRNPSVILCCWYVIAYVTYCNISLWKRNEIRLQN